MKRYSLTLIAIAISSILLAQDGIQFTKGSWTDILKKAKNENKNIFIDCYTSWCGPCKKLTAQTFPLKEVGDYYNPNFVSIKIDMEEEGDGVMLQKKFDVNLFPTMIICNDKGDELHRFTGYISGEKVIQEAKRINGGKVLAYYKNKYDDGNSKPKFVKEYIDYLNSGYQKAKLSPITDAYLISIGSDEWKSEESWKLISSCMNEKTGNSPVIKYVQKNLDAYNELYGEKEVAKVLTRKFYESAKLFYTTENNVVSVNYPAFNQYLSELRELNVENVDNIKLNAEIHYTHICKEWDKYIGFVEQKIASKKMQGVHYWIYANNINEDCNDIRVKKEALNWCDQGLDIATRERRKKLLNELKVKLVADINITANPINDSKIQSYFHEKAQEWYDANDCVPFSELLEQTSKEHCTIDVNKLNNNQGTVSYEAKKKGTLILGKLGKCASCPNIHLFTASAFAISEDGLCVTNNHVFSPSSKDKNSYMAVFVMDSEGNVFPVEEVLAANKEDDIAIFRVNTNGKELSPLALGSEVEIGAEVSVLGHPKRQYYTYTKGYVSRHFESRNAPRFSITADFAVGSSGGPIFNSEGNVVGIVSATKSNYDSSHKTMQMVVKIAIPVNGLKKLYNENE